MATNRVSVSYSETYDFNTVQGRLSVLGFHTPSFASISKHFKGLLEQFDKIKFESCDIALACASQLPVDPLGIGTEGGVVAPEDVLNPILFKACTGEQLNSILDIIYNNSGSAPSIANSSVDKYDVRSGESGGSTAAAIDMYYTLLSDNSYRKAHPQAGMRISRLVPMVHNISFTRPFGQPNVVTRLGSANNSGDSVGIVGANPPVPVYSGTLDDMNLNGSVGYGAPGIVNSGVRRLPAQNTLIKTAQGVFSAPFAKIYLGCLVLPPSILQSLYYRIRVTWNLSFYGFRSYTELNNVGEWDSDGLYTNGYLPPGDSAQSVSLLDSGEVVDTLGVDSITPVTTSVM